MIVEQPTKLLVQLSVLSMLRKGDRLITGQAQSIKIDRREPGEWHYWQSIHRWTSNQNRSTNITVLDSVIKHALDTCCEWVATWKTLPDNDHLFEYGQMIERLMSAISQANAGLSFLIETYLDDKHTVAHIKVIRGTIDFQLKCIRLTFTTSL